MDADIVLTVRLTNASRKGEFTNDTAHAVADELRSFLHDLYARANVEISIPARTVAAVPALHRK